MTIEIKEGRYYRDRMGQVHGPMLRSSLDYWPWTLPDANRSWMDSGSYSDDGEEEPYDLVEEVRIVPVNSEGGEG